MITYFSADNYKSLDHFHLSLTGFGVLVGNNASGKSTVLQAIDFLMRSAVEDFPAIIGNRGLSVSDIVSKLTTRRQIRFMSEYALPAENRMCHLRWDVVMDASIKDNMIKLSSERITDLDKNKVLLSYESGKELTVADGSESGRVYPQLAMESSAMKIAVDVKSEKSLPELVALKRFLMSSCSYDMLSPSEMRQSSRGRTSSIGTSGRDLAAFIKSMSKEQEESFMKTLHSLLGQHFLEEVEAHTKGKPGWTTIESVERYGNTKVRIASKGMSDGMLRLLAFIAINETEAETSLILLDEIENGINSNYAEQLMSIMKHSYENKHRQMIVTTHSTAFLDYVSAEDIIYLYRDEKTGFSRAVKMLDIAGMKEKTEYMYPGEVFMNLSNREIMKQIMKSEDSYEGD